MQPRTVRLDVRQAIEGFLLAKQAEGCSPNTITDYRNCLAHHLCGWLAENGRAGAPLDELAPTDLRAFLAQLRATDNGRGQPLSPKTIRNVHVALQSLYAWAHTELGVLDIMPHIPAPKAAAPLIEPLSQEQVSALLQACDLARDAQTRARKSFAIKRDTAVRDRAIILLLVDTGMWAGELARLTFADVDLAAVHGAIRPQRSSSLIRQHTSPCTTLSMVKQRQRNGKTRPTSSPSMGKQTGCGPSPGPFASG